MSPTAVEDEEELDGRFDAPDEQAAGAGRARLACPECGFLAKSEVGLGAHRYFKHNVPGSSSKGGSGRARGERLRPPRPPGRPPGRKTIAERELRDAVRDVCVIGYEGGGRAWSRFDPLCGGVWADCRVRAEDAWFRASQQNDWLREFFLGTSASSVWAMLFTAHAPVIVCLYEHHLSGMIASARPAPAGPEPGSEGAEGGPVGAGAMMGADAGPSGF